MVEERQDTEEFEVVNPLDALSQEQLDKRREIANSMTGRTASMCLYDAEKEESKEVVLDDSQIELREYIGEMLLLITTGDEDVDMANIEMIADNIHAKAVQVHTEYQKHLKENKKVLDKELKKSSKKDDEAVQELSEHRDAIADLLNDMEEAPSREKVVEYLKNLRTEFLKQVAEGGDPAAVSKSMGAQVFEGGMVTL